MTEPMTTLASGRFVNLVARGGWEFAQRHGVTGIVGVVAITQADELVLVEQHRPPVAASVIEIPAGLAGDSPATRGEPLEDAARRELIEETGYAPNSMRWLARAAPSAGITDEMIDFFLATGLRRVGEGGGDEHERIQVHCVPRLAVDAWLADRVAAGAVVDAKVYAALYWAWRAVTPGDALHGAPAVDGNPFPIDQRPDGEAR